MRTMLTATMMLMATVMMARTAAAGPAFRDGMRPSPRPVSTLPMLGTTHGIRALTKLESVRIEKLAVAGVSSGVATVPFLVEPRVLAGATYRAQLSMNGETLSERRIAPGTTVIVDAPVPADGEIHAVCVSVQRVAEGVVGVQAARRCFDVVVPPSSRF